MEQIPLSQINPAHPALALYFQGCGVGVGKNVPTPTPTSV
jgi:hypothetical protein